VRPSKDVVSRRVGDEIVLVNLESDQMYSLNPTGARAWELLAAESSRQEIRAELLREFDVGEKELDEELYSTRWSPHSHVSGSSPEK